MIITMTTVAIMPMTWPISLFFDFVMEVTSLGWGLDTCTFPQLAGHYALWCEQYWVCSMMRKLWTMDLCIIEP